MRLCDFSFTFSDVDGFFLEFKDTHSETVYSVVTEYSIQTLEQYGAMNPAGLIAQSATIAS